MRMIAGLNPNRDEKSTTGTKRRALPRSELKQSAVSNISLSRFVSTNTQGLCFKHTPYSAR